jgi:hypothetical protein
LIKKVLYGIMACRSDIERHALLLSFQKRNFNA